MPKQDCLKTNKVGQHVSRVHRVVANELVRAMIQNKDITYVSYWELCVIDIRGRTFIKALLYIFLSSLNLIESRTNIMKETV